jgi:GNAT superfamily N-acetyltransferase
LVGGRSFSETTMPVQQAARPLIRPCRIEEIEALLALWRQAAATPAVPDTAEAVQQAITASPAHVLVAEIDGRIVGSIIGAFDGWRGNLYRLAVHPDYRRRGIARALVVEVEQRLAQDGARRITALVERDCPWATGFWEAAGYAADVESRGTCGAFKHRSGHGTSGDTKNAFRVNTVANGARRQSSGASSSGLTGVARRGPSGVC